jgi:cell division protein FtsB
MKAFFKNTVARMAVLIFVVFFLVVFTGLRLKQNDLETKADELREEVDEMEEYISELQADIDRPFDDEYVAEIAHDKLGLRYPQEIIYYSGSGD